MTRFDKIFSSGVKNKEKNNMYKFHVPDGLTEHVVISESRDKPIVLFHLLEDLIYKAQRTLVFVSSVESTHRLCTLMKIIEEKFDTIKSTATVFAEYSSRLSRSKRSLVLQQFVFHFYRNTTFVVCRYHNP